MANQLTHQKGAYTSFGGADITMVIGTTIVGSLQAISYSVTREKGPIYVMNGSANPIAFARGKRAVAGTLVLLTIDQQAFLNHMQQTASGTGAKFYGQTSDIKYDYNDTSIESLFAADLNNNPVADTTGVSETNTLNNNFNRQFTDAWYADQVLPFDVNIVAANEYGQAMKKSIIGVEILNEGGGVSIDDLVIEEQYTYIARDMTKWVKVIGPNGQA